MKSFIKFLIEYSASDVGGSSAQAQPGTPASSPNIPVQGPGGDYPRPPGIPSFWNRPGSGSGFNGDGELPGDPPGPNDPRWGEWDRQWQENNPKPTRQPNESDKDFRKRVDEYRKLLEQHRIWKYRYLKWWQRTHGPGVVQHDNN